MQAQRAKNGGNLPVCEGLCAKHAVQCMAQWQSRRVWFWTHRAIRRRGNLHVWASLCFTVAFIIWKYKWSFIWFFLTFIHSLKLHKLIALSYMFLVWFGQELEGWGEIIVENFISSSDLPVANYLSMATNRCSTVIAFLILVYFILMRGSTCSDR